MTLESLASWRMAAKASLCNWQDWPPIWQIGPAWSSRAATPVEGVRRRFSSQAAILQELPPPQVLDPYGGVHENHFELLGELPERRLRTGRSCFSVPPSEAKRRAATAFQKSLEESPLPA